MKGGGVDMGGGQGFFPSEEVDHLTFGQRLDFLNHGQGDMDFQGRAVFSASLMKYVPLKC